MNRPLLTSTLLLAALTGALFAFTATADELPQVRPHSAPVVVTAELARQRTWKLQVPTLGELAAVEGLEVATKCAGRVRSIHFESGENVALGQLLVQLDDAVERARLASLRARLAQARAALARELPEPEEADRTREVETLLAQIEEQQQLADDKRVLAPFSGQLGMREVHVGQYLEPGDALVALRKLAPIHVEFTLPEQRFGAIEVGAALEVRVGALPDRVFAGTVSAVEPWIEPTTRSFRLKGVLANADGALRPGMLASVSVRLLDERDVVTIPTAAVRRGSHGSTVFLVEGPVDGGTPGTLVVSRRFLKLGERRGAEVAVLSGLEPGARVVVASPHELADGTQVLLSGAGVP
jgi:membrane fusion protein (multidrug efflux system)